MAILLEVTWEIADDLIALLGSYTSAVYHFIFKDNGFADDKAMTSSLKSLKSAGFPVEYFNII